MNNKIPIFPLSNVIFFPETDLPLNIFEKKIYPNGRCESKK